MKRELELKLQEKYPKIFKDLYGDIYATCMHFGICCGDGWYFILDNLCGSIQSYIDNNSIKTRVKNKFARKFLDILRKIKHFLNFSKFKFIRKFGNKFLSYKNISSIENKFKTEKYETISQVVAEQIKEKFGGLRFYFHGGDSKISGMVWLAETLCDNTCEICGSTKNVGRTKGWITTICEECYNSNESFKNKKWVKNE